MAFSANDLSVLDWTEDRRWLFLRRLSDAFKKGGGPMAKVCKNPPSELWASEAMLIVAFVFGGRVTVAEDTPIEWRADDDVATTASDLFDKLSALGALEFSWLDGFLFIVHKGADFDALLSTVELARAS